jgi:hypothetical protein
LFWSLSRTSVIAVRRFWRVALAWLGGGGLEALGDELLLVLEGLEA